VVQRAVEIRFAAATLFDGKRQVNGKGVVRPKGKRAAGVHGARNGGVRVEDKNPGAFIDRSYALLSLVRGSCFTRTVKAAVVSFPLTFPVNVPANTA
jgi:hypothetical protein